jgi:hypothetical protein
MKKARRPGGRFDLCGGSLEPPLVKGRMLDGVVREINCAGIIDPQPITQTILRLSLVTSDQDGVVSRATGAAMQ